MQKNKDKITYSKDYYRFQILIQDTAFKKEISWLHSQYKKFNCPIPKKCFKTWQDYEEWRDRFWKIWRGIEKSQIPAQMITTTSEVELENGSKKIKIKQDFDPKDPLYPPIPYDFIKFILNEFHFDSDNKKYIEFLENYIFRGKKEYIEEFFATKWIRNEKTDKFELFIQILPDTRKEHIDKYWHFISKEQKLFSTHRIKNKSWEFFNRDLYIYNTYKNLQNKLPSKRVSRKKLQSALDIQTLNIIKKKYPQISLEQIKLIVSRVNKVKA